MIEDMKVFDGSGELIKVIPGKKLSKKFWRRFHENSDPFVHQKEIYREQYGSAPVFAEGDEDYYGQDRDS